LSEISFLSSAGVGLLVKGASALNKLLAEQKDAGIRVFVVWEPVLPTDLGAPSTTTLNRLSDPRVSQYWD